MDPGKYSITLSCKRMTVKILVIDDDEVTRILLQEVLEKEGYEVQLAVSGEMAVQWIQKRQYAIILSDIRMFDLDGMAVLREVKRLQNSSVVILMTGFGSMEGAIEAIQEGAFDYVSKPFQVHELKAIIARAVKYLESFRNCRDLSHVKIDLRPSVKTLIGKSPEIVEVYKVLARAAMSSSTVLVMGESGTGKELVARAIHENSQQKDKKFIGVNCGALVDNLLESELFGHVKGSFTGAMTDKRGLFEEAQGGTLFLDEIGDITPALQIKLLRVLQENEIKPVGSAELRKVATRIIAATHQDLGTLVQTGKFREDLYYRLKVISIGLPPLRFRMVDLSDLVENFLSKYSKKNKKLISHISDEAMSLLKNYSWPGNIRELEHAIESAVAMANTSVLFPEDFPVEISKSICSDKQWSVKHPPMDDASLIEVSQKNDRSLEDLEKKHIIKTLKEVYFNKSKASEILGIDRATLYRKAQRYGIDLKGK